MAGGREQVALPTRKLEHIGGLLAFELWLSFVRFIRGACPRCAAVRVRFVGHLAALIALPRLTGSIHLFGAARRQCR